MTQSSVVHEASRHGAGRLPRRAGQRFSPRGARGFTLIEIIVVVVIIGLLAVLVVQNVIPMVDNAKVTKAKGDIRGFETALNFFYLDNSKYPSSEQGLKALVEQPTDPTVRHWHQYLQRLPKDPWGNEYVYQCPGTHGKYDIYTMGSDGQVGGEGTAADIGNWNLGDN
jgi:general secretion pathway protein G